MKYLTEVVYQQIYCLHTLSVFIQEKRALTKEVVLQEQEQEHEFIHDFRQL